MKVFTATTLDLAQRDLGVREVPPGSNAGPEVSAYLRLIDLASGNPWCLAFVFAKAAQAAAQLGVKSPLPKSGYCPVLERYARTAKILFDKPQAGDIFLSYSSPEGYRRASHTGFVTSVAGIAFSTIEGNTNDNGAREGIGVYARRRVLAARRYAFVRLDAVAPIASADPKPQTLAPGAVVSHIASPYTLSFGLHKVGILPVINNRSWCSIDLWCRALGFTATWNVDKQTYSFNGREASLDVLKLESGGAVVPMAPIRQLVRAAGLLIDVDVAKRQVVVTPKKAPPVAPPASALLPANGTILKGDGTWPFSAVVDGDDIILRDVRATWFGGDNDPMDSGATASGISTKGNPALLGCALPLRNRSVATQGSPIPPMPWKTVVRVFCPATKKQIDVPLIDLGPCKRTGNAIDLTQAAFQALGAPLGKGVLNVDVRILGGAQHVS